MRFTLRKDKEKEFQTSGMAWTKSFRGEENDRLEELKARVRGREIQDGVKEGGGAMQGPIHFGNQAMF